MVEEIKMLCKANGTSIKALERELGFGNGTIRRWDSSVPSYDKILKVADYFKCTVEIITGEMEQKEKPAQESGLSVDEIKEAFRGKSFEELTEILAALTDELKNTK